MGVVNTQRKSFAGESLKSLRLERYGLYGDRSHIFVDETKEGWSRYITARQIPEMLSYKAELDIQSPDLESPQVKITCSDGRIHQWNEELLKEIQLFSDKKISMERYSLKSQDQMAVDDGSILIITDFSLKKIEQLWGKSIDKRRFRANFLLSFYDDVNYNEFDFIGKRFIIGDTDLSIKSFCKRCSMITIDPENLEHGPTLLKKTSPSSTLWIRCAVAKKKFPPPQEEAFFALSEFITEISTPFTCKKRLFAITPPQILR